MDNIFKETIKKLEECYNILDSNTQFSQSEMTSAMELVELCDNFHADYSGLFVEIEEQEDEN